VPKGRKRWLHEGEPSFLCLPRRLHRNPPERLIETVPRFHGRGTSPHRCGFMPKTHPQTPTPPQIARGSSSMRAGASRRARERPRARFWPPTGYFSYLAKAGYGDGAASPPSRTTIGVCWTCPRLGGRGRRSRARQPQSRLQGGRSQVPERSVVGTVAVSTSPPPISGAGSASSLTACIARPASL
jgi:hypothetical protein